MSTIRLKSSEASMPKDCNVKVCVRCRPLNEKELAQKHKSVVSVDEYTGTISVKVEEKDDKEFFFDYVFDENSKQVDVYTKAAREILDKVLEGYNGTIFAYGQTGTGKTFTMEGDREFTYLKGIIPNCFAHIFGHIAKADSKRQYLVRVSYLQIYNEEVRDLLVENSTKKLDVKEAPGLGVFVQGLSQHPVSSPNEMEMLLTEGNKNRVTASTNMNEVSSRSHAVFTVAIECSEKLANGRVSLRCGKLNLVDLAGSERQAKTGATGQRLLEANKINLSLTTLGNVISSLVDKKSTHIPYRNSKLTRLLQDSLGGNANTVMIANIGPSKYNLQETLNTLRYANRAKNIKNAARINRNPKDAILAKYQEELESLRRQLQESPEVEIDENKINQMQKDLNENRRLYEMDPDMSDEERDAILEKIKRQELELGNAKSLHEKLAKKMADLEKQIIIGGENLLDKAEAQEKLLEESAQKMREQIERAESVREKLREKEHYRINIEQKYNSLQEEADSKNGMLRNLAREYIKKKNDLVDMKEEHSNQMKLNNFSVSELKRELEMMSILIDHYIPKKYQNLIANNVKWNEEIGEWHLKYIAYAGNNYGIIEGEEDSTNETTFSQKPEESNDNVYITYSEFLDQYRSINSS